MRIPPHIVKIRDTTQFQFGRMVSADYYDLLKDKAIMTSELPAYLAKLKPMVYWTTWAKYLAKRTLLVK